MKVIPLAEYAVPYEIHGGRMCSTSEHQCRLWVWMNTITNIHQLYTFYTCTHTYIYSVHDIVHIYNVYTMYEVNRVCRYNSGGEAEVL